MRTEFLGRLLKADDIEESKKGYDKIVYNVRFVSMLVTYMLFFEFEMNFEFCIMYLFKTAIQI